MNIARASNVNPNAVKWSDCHVERYGSKSEWVEIVIAKMPPRCPASEESPGQTGGYAWTNGYQTSFGGHHGPVFFKTSPRAESFDAARSAAFDDLRQELELSHAISNTHPSTIARRKLLALVPASAAWQGRLF
jgi:hypothetical protein